MFIKIANITIAVLSEDRKLKMRAKGVMKDFMVNGGGPDIEIKARRRYLSIESNGKKVFDSGALWQLYSDNGTYVFQFTSPAFGTFPYKIASFNKDFTKGEVSINRSYFDPNRCIYPLEYPLDELLLVNHLGMGKGVEVHASGVVDSSGQGHLFLGQSGAGKTTMARLWQDTPGVTILSDDRIILRQIDKKLWMYGTPWHGEAMLASPDRAPLERIYFLEKGAKNGVVSQKNSESVGNLIACSFIPFYSQDALSFTLSFFEEVVKAVPCYDLSFVPDQRVVEFVQKERFT
jgi:hypothetical protein